MSTVSQPLSYKFNAYFEDGTEIIQTDADESSIQEGKSAFFDVQEKMKTTKLLLFALKGEQGIFILDFKNLRFNVNTFDYSPLEQDEVIESPKLIYFREVLQHNTLADGVQEPYLARYFLGFEGKNEKGKVVKKLVNIEA